MEKFLLILALLGSAHLGLRSVLDAGKLLFGFGPPKTDQPNVVERPPGEAATIANEAPVKDWTQYDVPTFIRRGIVLPRLEPATPKATESGPPGGQSQIDVPSTPEAVEPAAFEIIA